MAYKLEHSHQVFRIENGEVEDKCALTVTIDKHQNGSFSKSIKVEGLEKCLTDIQGHPTSTNYTPKNIAAWFNCLSNLHELLKEYDT